ncbi:NAD/NADP octopine/nopaline dehydrogenase family protein [Saccharopolyspora pogona]|uniref:NAD/NADP octopine/nopaline dehydrogenase family protein n=1 Tax=Saccharopolyspora pogona TaxID=333966 RepID=UPI00168274A4|nr:NAD/NADP octopine/nopaline dehydrogenase family protein [Saccharopolyspora pogona]
MSTVAVLGAGAGGLSAAAELSGAGHRVRLWNRNPATLDRNVHNGRIRYTGILGTGEVWPDLVTTDLADAISSADVVVVCLPGLAHHALFTDLAAARPEVPVVLNPGHTGGALHLRAVFTEHNVPLPPVAEFSTLTYVARVPDGTVRVSGRAARLWVACLPNGKAALDAGTELFTGAQAAPDVLFSSLANVNLVLHPPGAMLGLSWVEATGGTFTFYVEGMTPGVARVIEALDAERRAVAAAFGHRVPDLITEMAAIGTANPEAARTGQTMAAIRGGVANQKISAPDSLQHRYYAEDLPFGLLPFVVLAGIAKIPVPVASALLTLGTAATGTDPESMGLTAIRLGLAGLGIAEVLNLVREKEN